jgi:hypothetical protein
VPRTAELQKLADVAASQGKSFDQLTEAVLDAGPGEFERLKEFGIQASKGGDQVSFSFKGATKTVENTPMAINAALVGFGELNGVMGCFEAGATFAPPPGAPSISPAAASSQELIRAVLETRDAVRALPSRVQAFIDWNQDDAASLADALNERVADRAQGEAK